ncbi:hypothetical protein EMIHUDRAFT_247181, partial [Emiliania huxleyi CCMP1516]|uniref:Uncharacterized protein n=2 Tax=Emiliania huxleyi TaxID=2903 RepID=A0A0D3IP42_EMIH1
MCEAPSSSAFVAEAVASASSQRNGDKDGSGAAASSAAPAVDVEQESAYLLNDGRVGMALIGGSITLLALIDAALVAWLPSAACVRLGAVESNAVLLAFTVQTGSALEQLTRRPLPSMRWTSRCIVAVKLCAAATNLALYLLPTPFVVDAVTGRPNCMLRWGEWVVLAGLMTFVVDATDATRLRTPLITATSQALSTLCGLLLPLAGGGAAWAVTLVASFLLFSCIVLRLFEREARLRALSEQCKADSYQLAKARLAASLMRQCVGCWSLLVAVWCGDALARLLGVASEVDVGFVADAAIDVLAKQLYASAIEEGATAAPLLHGLERGREAAERMDFVWRGAADVIVVSRRVRDGLAQLEREATAAAVERQKDEEANRFSRHEVKNGVLAALSQLDSISAEMRRKALARDVLHGNYLPRTAPCKIEQAPGPLALGLAWQINERFPLTTHPSPLPVVDIDQRLLCLVHRNALSNACKYGRHGGVVATEASSHALVVLAGDQLTIRVVNEPGEQHESVRGLDPASAAIAFAFLGPGADFWLSSDEAIATARVSKGDGGWVMAKCAECMLGECSIAFREAET